MIHAIKIVTGKPGQHGAVAAAPLQRASPAIAGGVSGARMTGMRRKWRGAWLLSIGLLSACATARPGPQPALLRDAGLQPAAELVRTIGLIQQMYVVPVSLDRLLENGIKGLGRAAPPLTPSQLAALHRSARAPAQDDVHRAAAFTLAVLQAGGSSARPGGATEFADAVLTGMTTGLDPHSSYINLRNLRLLRSTLSGGVGLELRLAPASRVVVVKQPLAGSPAEQAGVEPGDVLQALDGQPVAGLPLEEVIQLLKGPVGSTVMLALTRPGRRPPLMMTVTRQPVFGDNVCWSLLGRVAYLRPGNFNSPAEAELRKAVAAAKAAAGGGLEGAVLDLRGNKGGLLDQTVAIAGDLLAPGRIVVTLRERGSDSDQTFRSSPAGSVGQGDLLAGAPLVVLVDGGTAAGAEILAGALQEHGRAVVTGSPTFGSGTVQTVVPLRAGLGAIRITTSRVYLPSGRALQRHGVVPDVPLRAGDAMQREADLPGSLPAEAAASTARPDLDAIRAQVAVLPAGAERINPAQPASDPEVGQALKILRLVHQQNPSTYH